MKCSSKTKKLSIAVRISLTALLAAAFLTGCGQAQFAQPYTASPSISSFRIVNLEEDAQTAVPFADNLCVVNGDIGSANVDMSNASAAGLFDLNRKETLYAKNVHERLYPASLTKIMTALIALENGSSDMMLTASANVRNLESGAQVCGIKEGDQMTLDQALHLLLINSANDAGVMIAEGVAGSCEE